jgi:cellulose synthase operon protein C
MSMRYTLLILSLFLVGCKDKQADIKEEVDRYIKSASAYVEQGQFRAAMVEAKNAIQKDPNDARGYIALSSTYNKLGAYDSTQALLEPMVQKMPQVAMELYEAYVAKRKFQSASHLQETFNLKIPADTTFDTALNESSKSLKVKGDIALRENKLDEAEAFYSKALGLLPKTDILTIEKLTLLEQLTEVLIRQGKSNEALRYQKLLADANPAGRLAKNKFYEAVGFLESGDLVKAEQHLNELRENNPQDKNAAMLLGLVELQKGKDDQAVELFDQYIDPETALPGLVQAAAMAKFRLNKNDDAIVFLKEAAESQPNNAEILTTYGLALLQKDGTSAEGEKALEKSLALNPKQHRLRLALAKRHFELKNPALGLGQLKKAYTEQPLDLVIQQIYFKALHREEKFDILKNEITEFSNKYPENPRSNFNQGWLALILKSYPEAEQQFKKAISVNDNEEKNLAYFYRDIANLALTEVDKNAAIKWYEKSIELDPNLADSLNNLAWLYFKKNDQRAKDLAERAYRIAPENPNILDTYGWILVESQQPKEGHELLARAAATAPDNQQIQEHLAIAAQRIKECCE